MSEHWGLSFVISVIVVVSLLKFICHPFSCISRITRYCNVYARYCHGQRGFANMPNVQSGGYCCVCQPPSAGFRTLFDCVYGCIVNTWNCAIKYSVRFLVTQNFRRNGIFPSLNITCFAFLYVLHYLHVARPFPYSSYFHIVIFSCFHDYSYFRIFHIFLLSFLIRNVPRECHIRIPCEKRYRINQFSTKLAPGKHVLWPQSILRYSLLK